jgi:hypothetical protein
MSSSLGSYSSSKAFFDENPFRSFSLYVYLENTIVFSIFPLSRLIEVGLSEKWGWKNVFNECDYE